jgi:hypothetical protein
MFGDPASTQNKGDKVPLGELIKVSSGNGLVAKDMASDGIYPVYGGNGINGYHSEYMFDTPQIMIGRVGAYCGAIHVSEPNSWITDTKQVIDLKPITLLFGPNSAGKSTILQSLHYLREILERRNADPDQTIAGGLIALAALQRSFTATI